MTFIALSPYLNSIRLFRLPPICRLKLAQIDNFRNIFNRFSEAQKDLRRLRDI